MDILLGINNNNLPIVTSRDLSRLKILSRDLCPPLALALRFLRMLDSGIPEREYPVPTGGEYPVPTARRGVSGIPRLGGSPAYPGRVRSTPSIYRRWVYRVAYRAI